MDGLPLPVVVLSGELNWTVGFLTTAAIFAILALGLNVQWGATGVFNFGIAAFFMVGAYVSSILTLPPPELGFERHVGGFSLPIPIGWLAGMGAAGALALLVGLPTLRLRRDFLAIATIGVAAILRSVATSVDGLVNRARGLQGVPRFLDGLASGADYRWVALGIALVALALVYVLLQRGLTSPWGRVLRAIRENEDTAKAAGKDTVNFRLQSFVLGGMIMGLAGGIFAHRTGAITPSSFSDLFGTFVVWAMLIVGGSGNNRGAILGAVVVWFFWSGTALVREDLPDFLGNRIFAFRELMIGLLIVIFVLWRSQGLLPEERRVSRFLQTGRSPRRWPRWPHWRRPLGPEAPPVSGVGDPPPAP